jgi:acyl carrier protein
MKINIKEKISYILQDLAQSEYKDIFQDCESDQDRLELLTSESMLAIVFISSLEDEFSIEFEDDELDINFFSSMEIVESIIIQHLT